MYKVNNENMIMEIMNKRDKEKLSNHEPAFEQKTIYYYYYYCT